MPVLHLLFVVAPAVGLEAPQRSGAVRTRPCKEEEPHNRPFESSTTGALLIVRIERGNAIQACKCGRNIHAPTNASVPPPTHAQDILTIFRTRSYVRDPLKSQGYVPVPSWGRLCACPILHHRRVSSRSPRKLPRSNRGVKTSVPVPPCFSPPSSLIPFPVFGSHTMIP